MDKRKNRPSSDEDAGRDSPTMHIEYMPEEWATALKTTRECDEGACLAVVTRGKERMLRIFGSRAEFDAFEETGVQKPREPIQTLSLNQECIAATLRVKASCGGSLHGQRIFSSQKAMLEHANPLGHTFFVTLNHLRPGRLRGDNADDPKDLVVLDGHLGGFMNVYAFASFASEKEWFDWEHKLSSAEKVCFERVMSTEKAPGACSRVRPFFDMDSKGGERAAKFPAEAVEPLDVLESRMWGLVVKHSIAVAHDWWGRNLTLEEHFRIGVTCEEFRTYKLSNHIIIVGMGSLTMEGALAFALEVKRRAAIEDAFSSSTIDESVYTSGQNLRMIGHCKVDSPRRFVRPHPLFESASTRDFLLRPTAEELLHQLDPPEGAIRTRPSRARGTTEGEPEAKRRKIETRSVDASAVQTWLDTVGGVYAGEVVQKVSRSPAYPESVAVFFKGPVHCHHIGRPHTKNAQHVWLRVRDDGSVLQFCKDDNCKCKPICELSIEVPDDVLEALWPEAGDSEGGSGVPPPSSTDEAGQEPTGLGADEGNAEDRSGEDVDEALRPAPAVLPAFRKAAYEYVIRTQFSRHEDTTLVGDELSAVEKKTYTRSMKKQMKKDMKKAQKELDDKREAAKKAGRKRNLEVESLQDRMISDVVMFEQRLKSDGTYCPHFGAPHSTPTPIEFIARWFAPIKKKEIKFGERLRCTLSLVCADPRCKALDCSVGLEEDAEHYAAYREKCEKTAFRVKCPKIAYGFEGTDEVHVLNRKGFKDQYESAPKFFGLPFDQVYAGDPGARTYNKMDIFPPGAVFGCPSGTYNMWRGFAVARITPREAALRPAMFLDTVEKVFGPCHADFVINHMAWTIQFPGKRTDLMVIVYGPEGCGKNALYDRTLGRMMGPSYYAYSFNPEALIEKHSELNNGKILIVFDDFNPKKGRKVAEEIKSRSTSETVTYERKNVQSVQLTNYSNLVFLTNLVGALKFKGDCRRVALLECRNELVGNAQFWAEYEAYIDDPKNLRDIYDYLMELDLSNVSLRRDRPKTQIMMDHQFADLEPEFHFLFFSAMQRLCIDPANLGEGEFSMHTFFDGKWTVSNDAFYKEYTCWWPEQNFGPNKTPKPRQNFGQWFAYNVKSEGGFQNDTGRKHGSTYKFDNKLLVPFLEKKGFSFDSGEAPAPDPTRGDGGPPAVE